MARFARDGDFARAAGGGVVAGIVGGIVLSVLLAGMTLASGGELWPVLKFAGAPFLGERSFAPDFDPFAITVGFASHFAVSMGWGALFGLLFFGLDRMLTLLLGAVWGVVVWLGMHYAVMPMVGLGVGSGEGTVGVTVLMHVIFGVAVAVGFLPFQVPRIRQHPPRIRQPVAP